MSTVIVFRPDWLHNIYLSSFKADETWWPQPSTGYMIATFAMNRATHGMRGSVFSAHKTDRINHSVVAEDSISPVGIGIWNQDALIGYIGRVAMGKGYYINRYVLPTYRCNGIGGHVWANFTDAGQITDIEAAPHIPDYKIDRLVNPLTEPHKAMYNGVPYMRDPLIA